MTTLLAIIRNRNLALLFSGRAASLAGDSIYEVTLSVAIYRDSGGKTVYVGLLWILFLVPSMLLGPISGGVADRIGYRRAMILSDIGRLVLVVALALILRPSSWVVVYPFVVLAATLGTVFRPAAFGLFSGITEPDQRVGAIGVLMQIQSIATIVGSALAGLGAGLVTLMLLLDAMTFAISILSLWLIRIPASRATALAPGDAQPAAGWLYGFRLVASRPLLVFAVTVMALPELGSGALTVWLVPFSVHIVHLGSSGVGYLYTAIGIGAFLGGFVAAMVGDGVRLDRLLTVSVGLGGIALLLFGLSTYGVVALLFAAVLGLIETVEYAAYGALLQQSIPESAFGRVSGALESFFSALILIGTAISGVVAALFGIVAPLVALGALIAAASGLAWIILHSRTAGRPSVGDLASMPELSALPSSTLEWAVRRMRRERFAAGATVIQRGEKGEKFYVIAQGTAQVEAASGDNGETRVLGPGSVFGEIALLHDVPRTATVRALEPLTAYVLGREDFEELQEYAPEFHESLWQRAASRLAGNGDLSRILR